MSFARGEFKLRRAGGPAFDDAELQALVGRHVAATGIVSAGQLIASTIDVIESR
jgi:hypothetical protein